MKTEVKYYDELFGRYLNGEVIIGSWVYEDDAWGYRELTPDEVKKVLELQVKSSIT